MKMKWWGWIGILIIIWAAGEAAGRRIAVVGSEIGYGIGAIGMALSIFPAALLYMCAGILIWISARDKSN